MSEREPVLPAFFDKNPELKERVIRFLKTVPEAQRNKSAELFKKFVTGEITWAEVKNIPQGLLKEITDVAYLKFQMKDYSTAEILFKGLAVLDHHNWYYRAALGAVFQKQKLFEQAIEEFNIALSLKEDEITSLVNRGECYFRLADYDAALKDFTAAKDLPTAPDGVWKNKAQLLIQKVKVLQKG